jgi:HEAT repeat protein
MESDEMELAFGEALENLLTDEQVPIHLLYRLSDMSPEEFEIFERRWGDAGDERRRQIVRHLADISEEDFIVDFLPVFAYCLADPNPEVRAASLDGMWDATDLSLVDPIIERLQQDEFTEVRAAAAGALAHFLLMAAWGELQDVRSDDIVKALMSAYQDPDSPTIVRRVALEALGSINSPQVSKAIEDSYESPDRMMQLGALFAMGNSADPRWLAIVLDETESPFEEIRLEAVRAAGNIGDERAVPRLAELAYDDSEAVALAAIEALGEIGGDRVHEILAEMLEDEELEDLEQVIEEALEEASWSALDLQFGLFGDDYFDEEE